MTEKLCGMIRDLLSWCKVMQAPSNKEGLQAQVLHSDCQTSRVHYDKYSKTKWEDFTWQSAILATAFWALRRFSRRTTAVLQHSSTKASCRAYLLPAVRTMAAAMVFRNASLFRHCARTCCTARCSILLLYTGSVRKISCTSAAEFSSTTPARNDVLISSSRLTL